jgi:hypothetical protein
MNAAELAAVNYPPRVAGTDPAQAWYSAATALAATSTDLWASFVPDGYTGAQAPPGKVWVELEATGFDVYVRFSRTASIGTTTANGSLIRIAHTGDNIFYIDPTKDKFLDHISPGGVGVVKWRVKGPIGDRSRV